MQHIEHGQHAQWGHGHSGGQSNTSHIRKGKLRNNEVTVHAAILDQTSIISTNLRSFLLKLLNGSLVNPSTLVNEMASGGGLARVDMTNNNNVDVNLFLGHFDLD